METKKTLYIISIDAYGTRRSKNFNKVISAIYDLEAIKEAEKWAEELSANWNNAEFEEWAICEVEPCYDKDKKEGDVWAYVIDEETYSFSEE
jgi:hypothetical protein